MKKEIQGYVPPSGYVPPKGVETPLTPKEMFVVAPSLDKGKDMSISAFKEYMADYAELDRVAKQIKEKQDAIKAVVHEGLKELGLETAKTDYGTFTIVAENTTERFDSKTFKEESPRIYNLYVKPSVTKEYLKVTPKKIKK